MNPVYGWQLHNKNAYEKLNTATVVDTLQGNKFTGSNSRRGEVVGGRELDAHNVSCLATIRQL